MLRTVHFVKNAFIGDVITKNFAGYIGTMRSWLGSQFLNCIVQIPWVHERPVVVFTSWAGQICFGPFPLCISIDSDPNYYSADLYLWWQIRAYSSLVSHRSTLCPPQICVKWTVKYVQGRTGSKAPPRQRQAVNVGLLIYHVHVGKVGGT